MPKDEWRSANNRAKFGPAREANVRARYLGHVSIGEVEVVYTTEKAILIVHGGAKVWIPKSQIAGPPPVTGEIVDLRVSAYFADKMVEGKQRYRDSNPADGSGYVVLTRELIHAGAKTGYWNKEQLAAIGILWGDTKRSGWIARNCGRRVTEASYRRFMALARQPKPVLFCDAAVNDRGEAAF